MFQYVSTLRPRQNGRHFADDNFESIFSNENVRIYIEISLKFVPKGPINNIPALVKIMAWRRPCDKPCIIWINDCQFTGVYMRHSASMSWILKTQLQKHTCWRSLTWVDAKETPLQCGNGMTDVSRALTHHTVGIRNISAMSRNSLKRTSCHFDEISSLAALEVVIFATSVATN